MAILKSKEIAKMSEKDITEKINELRMEMIKARVASKKGGKSNLVEMKRTIARLLTAQTMKDRAKPKAAVKNKAQQMKDKEAKK